MWSTAFVLGLLITATEPPTCLHHGHIALVGTVRQIQAPKLAGSVDPASEEPRDVFQIDLPTPTCVAAEGGTRRLNVAIDRLDAVQLDTLTPGTEDRLRHRVGSQVRCEGELSGSTGSFYRTPAFLRVDRCEDQPVEPLSDDAKKALRDHVIQDARAALRKTAWVTLLSLDPNFEYEHFSQSRQYCGKGSFCFHDMPVLGSYHAQSKADIDVITRVLDNWLAEPEPELLPACYAPRHGIRFETDGHVYDAEMCFECGHGYLYKDFEEKPVATIYAGEPSNTWNDLLTDKGVPLSNAARRGDRSPNPAKP